MKKHLSIIALLFWAIFMSSCSLFKKSRTADNSIIVVQSNDSTHLNKSESGSEVEHDWWRNVFIWPGSIVVGDTLKASHDNSAVSIDSTLPIFPYHPSMSISYSNPKKDTLLMQPMIYIQEGGKYAEKTWNVNIDSIARAITDSIASRQVVKEQTAKGEAMTPAHLFVIILLAVITLLLLLKK